MKENRVQKKRLRMKMKSSLGEECVVLITCSIPFLFPSWPFVLAWPCLCFCLTARPHMAVHPTHIPDMVAAT